MWGPLTAIEKSVGASCNGLPVLPAPGLACLRELAARYVWWKTPDEAMRFPERVAMQVMNLGTWEDATAMVAATGEDYLRGLLQGAEAGQLDARSWNYWHYRLGLAEYGVKAVPPMPARKTA
jgi:hypothetical protein